MSSRKVLRTPMELHPKEEQLIKYLREKFRYGEVVVLMRDGLPSRIARTVEHVSIDGRADEEV